MKNQKSSPFEFWKTALKAGVPFGFVTGTYQGFSLGLPAGVQQGCIQGLIFGVLMAILFQRFARSERLTNQKRVDPVENEPAIHETPAGHIKFIETRGGRLYLTRTKLIFKPHAFNLQKTGVNLSLSEISNVSCFKTLGFFANGLVVKTATQTEKFVVDTNQAWVDQINAQKSKLAAG